MEDVGAILSKHSSMKGTREMEYKLEVNSMSGGIIVLLFCFNDRTLGRILFSWVGGKQNH